MKKRILLDALYPEEIRVAVHDGKRILEYDYQSIGKKQQKGNIYLAKITRVEPSLQAAFIDYGGDRHGFLPFLEIHPDYFNIPHDDKIKMEQDVVASVSEEVSAESEEGDEQSKPEVTQHPRRKGGRNRNHKEAVVDGIPSQEGIESSNPEKEGSAAIHHIEDGVEKFESNSDNCYADMYKKYKIQEVVKKGQVILVQAIKEERGNKGASFTSYMSLAGKYCVLMPNSEKQGGISKKIFDLDDRNRLKKIVDSLNLEKGSSVIIRTAGGSKNDGEIRKDCEYLVKLWSSIRQHTLSSKAPAFIHAEADIVIRTIRDLCDNDTDEIVIQGDDAYKLAKDLMVKLAPSSQTKIKKYEDKVPIFTRYKIDSELSQLYNPTAKLESGGYIVINPTEALIAIDVNSGKSTSERNIEETALKTNLEAISEISRQLKLRDLSGLIVIDFIDMLDAGHRRQVEKKLRDAFQYDRARVQIGTISPFGLLEMSRQRMRSSIIEANTIICPHCSGKGYIRSPEHNAIHILKTIQAELMEDDFELVNVYAHPDIIVYLINNNLKDIVKIEENFNTKISFSKEYNISVDSFSIARVKRDKKAKEDQPTLTDPYSLVNVEDSVDTYETAVPNKDNAEFVNTNIDEAGFSSRTFKPSQRKYKKFPNRRRGGKPNEFGDKRNHQPYNNSQGQGQTQTQGVGNGDQGFMSKLWKKIVN